MNEKTRLCFTTDPLASGCNSTHTASAAAQSPQEALARIAWEATDPLAREPARRWPASRPGPVPARGSSPMTEGNGRRSHSGSAMPQLDEQSLERRDPRRSPEAVPGSAGERRRIPRLSLVHDRLQPDARVHEVPRRLLNVGVATLLIVATLPILLIIALLVKLTSPGSVIYTQTRVGLDRRAGRPAWRVSRRRDDLGGRPFTIYKFRTMRTDAEAPTGPVWASNDDARVTRLGRVLRQFRLDELPQLFNVLRGDMNLVGPRPERPTIFKRLREEIPDYQQRQRVRPGITGWAQVNQSYDTNLEDVKRKVQFDHEYIHRRGLTEDLKIMLRTVPVVLFKRGGW